MIKMIESPEFTDDEIRRANRVLSQIAKVVENAFSGFDTEWETKPTTNDYKNIDNELFVQSFRLRILISGIIFNFNIELSNHFSREFIKPRISFTFGGYEMRIINITPMVGNEIASAAKIAQRLQREIASVLKEYGE